MKKLAFAALAAALLLSAPARAEDGKIKVQAALDAFAALREFNGHQEIVGTGDRKQVVTVPYDLDASTVWAIADDLGVLQRFVVIAQATVKSLSDRAEADAVAAGTADENGKLKNGSPEQKALNDKIQEFLDSERPVDKLTKIKREALKVGAPNKFAPGVLANISVILDPLK